MAAPNGDSPSFTHFRQMNVSMKALILILTMALTLSLITTNTRAQDFVEYGGNTVTREFASEQELKQFLAEDNLNTKGLVIVGDLMMTLRHPCQPYAFQLQDRAEARGYELETEILSSAEYEYHYGYPADGKRHLICKAYIGDSCYFIEPMTDRHWRDKAEFPESFRR